MVVANISGTTPLFHYVPDLYFDGVLLSSTPRYINSRLSEQVVLCDPLQRLLKVADFFMLGSGIIIAFLTLLDKILPQKMFAGVNFAVTLP